MISFLISALKIIFLLGFLILIHEAGHFFVAKLFKVKVHEFAIGFGPKILAKQGKETKYEFSKYPEDEFWIVSDVDDNLDNHKTEFEKAIQECEKKGYKYAISNPFFEIWLLLHHDEVSEEDRKYAVTKTHPYEATDHFRIRLTEKGAPLRDQKHLKFEHYSDEKIRLAVQRAKELVKGKEEKIPSDYGIYMYQIIEEILEAVELPVEELDNKI